MQCPCWMPVSAFLSQFHADSILTEVSKRCQGNQRSADGCEVVACYVRWHSVAMATSKSLSWSNEAKHTFSISNRFIISIVVHASSEATNVNDVDYVCELNSNWKYCWYKYLFPGIPAALVQRLIDKFIIKPDVQIISLWTIIKLVNKLVNKTRLTVKS